ncbi:single-stranded DNA binding protein [Haloarcula laminariae]|uniref:single-stranded DNA binding protein n=1 Tax=Haloarcula laminariae TaxID=2961577 RepID=UPI0021C91FD4|nr:single-stranded DNA binding protein [Halomicroarcula laminariae]
MGEIGDIYADLETDVSEEEFREAVEEKVEQMGGLADEETAAMLLAHELNEGEVETVADIEPGMDEVKFIAKVMAIGDLKTFEREGEDEDGRVINVEAADETASVRLAFWDGQAVDIADGMLSVGDVLRVKGRPKDGYNGLEVSVDKAEQDEDATVDVEPGDGSTVDALTMGQSDVTLRGLVLDTDSVRTFDRDDGSEGKVSNLTLGDETGRVRVTMWDDRADRATEIEPGTAVEVVDGYVRERDGALELHVGDDGAVDEIDETVDFEPDADPIDSVELEATVDIAGVVRSADPVRTFDRDDGSEGQVRNIRVQDATGDIRVALWGDKADKDIQPGDEVLAADVEIQDGWQDDLEASASWNSTIVVLDDGATPAATPEEADDDQHAGLSSFADGDDGSDATAAADADGGATTDSGDATGGTQAAEQVEFTGTVVQTGDPVVLDDGEQTMSVETGERVQLGQEVTVRGVVEDGRLDADGVF